MKLNIFFLPFLAPGHMLPIVDMARVFAGAGVTSTVVTTPANAAGIGASISRPISSGLPIRLITIPFPSTAINLPEENLIGLPTPAPTPAFFEAIDLLEAPFRDLVREHRPDCIIADIFYTWSSDLAAEFGIPRIVFQVTNTFISPVALRLGKYLMDVPGIDEPFVLDGLPHRIEMTRGLMPDLMKDNELQTKMAAAYRKSYGIVVNSFYELERDYAEMMKALGMKIWLVGPVSLCNKDDADKVVRGNQKASVNHSNRCLSWLEKKERDSVLYICFGSLGKFTEAQVKEMAHALEASGYPFLWVINISTAEFLPEGFEERVLNLDKGLIVKGWVPQVLILGHPAVGGFMTHCGWNSTLEGVTAGVPLITWPLFADQAINAKFAVDVLRIGVDVGVKVCSPRLEERVLVKKEDITAAVEAVMGGGEQACERRRKAKELSEAARRAVEGGSSSNDLKRLIDELVVEKKRRLQFDLNSVKFQNN